MSFILGATGGGGAAARSLYNAGNSGAALTVNFQNGLSQKFTVTADCTLTVSNPTAGEWHYIEWIENSTGGYTVTLPTNFRFAGGTAPSWNTTAYKKNALVAYYDGADYLCTSMANIRNSSGLEGQGPSSLTDCLLWLEGDFGITKDGSDKVSRWQDQSYSGNDGTMTTGALQPTWIASTLNSQPGVRFAPASALGINSGKVFLDPSLPFTLVAIAKNRAFTASYPLFMGIKNTAAQAFAFGLSNDGSYSDWYFGVNGSGWVNLRCQSLSLSTSYHSYILDYNGGGGTTSGNYTAYLDGVSQSITSCGGTTASTFGLTTIGADLTSATGVLSYESLDGDIILALIFSKKLNNTERTTLLTYISGKYGI